eukprot:1183873-Alexandrium_andersonii.AAC.1
MAVRATKRPIDRMPKPPNEQRVLDVALSSKPIIPQENQRRNDDDELARKKRPAAFKRPASSKGCL